MRAAPLLLVLGLGLLGCGENPAKNDDPCPQGICGAGGGATGSTTGSGACAEAWSCSAWTKSDGDLYSRTCADANKCGTTNAKPPEGPVALPALDMDYYKCKVQPILAWGCSMLQ